jgi:hypothetical protein
MSVALLNNLAVLLYGMHGLDATGTPNSGSAPYERTSYMKFVGSMGNYRARSAVLAFGATVLSLALCNLAGAQSSFAQSAKTVAGGQLARLADGSSAVSKLKQIEAAAASESKATFAISYTSTGSGSSSTFTIEQKLPDQLFKTSSSEGLYNGHKTYYCSLGSTTTCVAYGSIDESPLEGLVEVYSAGTYVTVMQSWESILAYNISGVHVSFTSATFAGQASQCVTWSYQGSNAKYCVTDKGILAYAGGGKKGSSSTNFELTSYSSKVNSSDFNLPKGAKVQASI